MIPVIEQTFNGETVNVDGNAFHRCQFVNCTVVYSGGEIPSMENCSLNGCRWQFADAAQRTLQFLGALYSDPSAKPLVEQIFDSIRVRV
jgi:hypothetical protein